MDNEQFAAEMAKAPMVGGAPEGALNQAATQVPGLDAPAPAPVPAPAPAPPKGSRIPSEEFAAFKEAFPSVAEEFHNRTVQAEQLKSSREESRRQMDALQGQILELTKAVAQGSRGSNPNDIDDIPDDTLRNYVDKAERLFQAAVADPENEEIRKAAAEIDMNRVNAVREQLEDRRVKRHLSGLEQKLEAQNRDAAYAGNVQAALARELGSDSLSDDPTGVLSVAQEKISEAAQTLGISDEVLQKESTSARSLMAMLAARLANLEVNRGGDRGDQMPPAVRRSLDLEAGTRSATSANAQRSAALARGDTEAVYQSDLDSWLDANYS